MGATELLVLLPNYDVSTDLFLKFEGIDLIGDVYLNENHLGQTVNAFRSHTFLINPSILKSSGNIIRVDISNPIPYAKQLSDSYPYSVPATHNFDGWNEPSYRQFMRKTGSDMGWDWGPGYVSIFIIFYVYFHSFTHFFQNF